MLSDHAVASKSWLRLHWPRPSLSLLLGLVVGFSTGQSWPWLGPLGCAPARETAAFRILPEAWHIIQRNYVDHNALAPFKLAHAAAAAMVAVLGDTGHSMFLSPGLSKQLEQTARGQLHGVGLEVQVKDGRPTVVSPLDDSPAARAGVRPGEVILKINREPVTGLPLAEVAARISGAAGSSVKLTLLNPKTGVEREVSIVRAKVRLHTVTWARLANTGIVQLRIARFDENTGEELRDALRQIHQDGPAGIVLDLRNNPGGVLDSAVAVASDFLEGGNVMIVKNAQGSLRTVPVEKSSTHETLPVIVLVNRGSASAAEILAGALRDQGRARLVGERTFGTGTVLRQFELSDGSALLLAVQEWLTPKGQSFWHKGIDPDVSVELRDPAKVVTPEKDRTWTASELRDCGDPQLLKALDLLHPVSPTASNAGR